MSDIAELRHRLVLVEEQVIRLVEDSAATNAMAAMADRDVAAYRQEMRSHIRVINALRETQLEQGQVQVAQSRELGALRETQLEQGQVQVAQSRELGALRETQLEQQHELAEHRRILDRHTAMLNGHTAMLDEHGEALTSLVAGQTGVMRRLDNMLRHFGLAEQPDGDPPQN